MHTPQYKYQSIIWLRVSIIALAIVGYSTVVRPMNLYVPLGSSPEIGRSRPCQIGKSADAEEAWSMYHGSAYPPVRTEGSDHGPCVPSRPCVTSQPHVGVLACALPPVLQCCGVVQRQPGVADAMIEAGSSYGTEDS